MKAEFRLALFLCLIGIDSRFIKTKRDFSVDSLINEIKVPSLEDLHEEITLVLDLVCSTLFPGNKSQGQNCTDALVQKAGLTNLPFLATKDVKTLSGVVQLVQTRGLDTEAVKNLLVAQEQLATAQSKVYDIKGQIEAVMDVSKVQRELANSIVSSQSLDPATKVSLLIDNALMSKPDLELPVSSTLSNLSIPQIKKSKVGALSKNQIPLSIYSMEFLPIPILSIDELLLNYSLYNRNLINLLMAREYSNQVKNSAKINRSDLLEDYYGKIAEILKIIDHFELPNLEYNSYLLQRENFNSIYKRMLKKSN